MSDQREGGITWTDQTWNPIRGCTRVSEGCRHCYAEAMATRFCGPGQPYEGLANRTPTGGRWTGNVRLITERLADPLRWQRPRRIFVNSMSDLFHDGLTNADIDRVFAIMALAPQHIFQVLTKRPERMRQYLAGDRRDAWAEAYGPGELRFSRYEVQARISSRATPDQRWLYNCERVHWPLPNVWLGVSVEDRYVKDRIDILRATPAALRFLSCEPLIGDLGTIDLTGINWVICGGESGPHARPMHPNWAQSLRDQCAVAGVPFHFKQWGAWEDSGPAWGVSSGSAADLDGCSYVSPRGICYGKREDAPPGSWAMRRVGKRDAGRLLDENLHDAMPEVSHD